jgi:hypothetical protein
MGYENAARINAAGYQVFGEDLPDTFVSTDGYSHNATDWPGSVWDFSGCPLAKTVGASAYNHYTGALITPRHLLCAHHTAADFADGQTVTFVDLAGTKIERTISARSGLIGSDCYVVTLNSAVTGCKVYAMPTAESIASVAGATLWCLKRSHKIVTRTASTISSSYVSHSADSTAGALVSGDSGQPAFVTRGTDLVLIGTHNTATGIANASSYLSSIQTVCDATSQTITTVSVDPASWVQPLAAAI